MTEPNSPYSGELIRHRGLEEGLTSQINKYIASLLLPPMPVAELLVEHGSFLLSLDEAL